jgi:4-hydroxysphinganine ceramide fatty acyl 2-hydroxylase
MLLGSILHVPLINLLPSWFAYPYVLGVLIGYQIYDLMHYFLHHATPADDTFFKTMKVYHMQHHYKQGQIGFGVSSKFWDNLFNTEIPTSK